MSEKYKREIEEILEKTEIDWKPAKAKKRNRIIKAPQLPLGQLFSGKSVRVSPSKLMVAGVSLLLVALILGAINQFSIAVGPLIWVGLAMFILAYALFFVRPSSGTGYEKRWRGRPIDNDESLWQKVRRWFSNR